MPRHFHHKHAPQGRNEHATPPQRASCLIQRQHCLRHTDSPVVAATTWNMSSQLWRRCPCGPEPPSGPQSDPRVWSAGLEMSAPRPFPGPVTAPPNSVAQAGACHGMAPAPMPPRFRAVAAAKSWVNRAAMSASRFACSRLRCATCSTADNRVLLQVSVPWAPCLRLPTRRWRWTNARPQTPATHPILALQFQNLSQLPPLCLIRRHLPLRLRPNMRGVCQRLHNSRRKGAMNPQR